MFQIEDQLDSEVLFFNNEALTLVTPPVEEPITYDEARQHMNITADIDRPKIESFIKASREYVEVFLNRQLITATYDLFMDRFPRGEERGRYQDRAIRPPKAPLQSVTSVKHIDTQGATQTLVEGTDYLVDKESEPGRITEFPGILWPSTDLRSNAVIVRFIAGFGLTAAIDERIRTAILMYVDDMYEHRGKGIELNVRPNDTAEALLWSSRLLEAN